MILKRKNKSLLLFLVSIFSITSILRSPALVTDRAYADEDFNDSSTAGVSCYMGANFSRHEEDYRQVEKSFGRLQVLYEEGKISEDAYLTRKKTLIEKLEAIPGYEKMLQPNFDELDSQLNELYIKYLTDKISKKDFDEQAGQLRQQMSKQYPPGIMQLRMDEITKYLKVLDNLYQKGEIDSYLFNAKYAELREAKEKLFCQSVDELLETKIKSLAYLKEKNPEKYKQKIDLLQQKAIYYKRNLTDRYVDKQLQELEKEKITGKISQEKFEAELLKLLKQINQSSAAE